MEKPAQRLGAEIDGPAAEASPGWRTWPAVVLALVLAFAATMRGQPAVMLNVPLTGTEGTALIGAGMVWVDGGTNHPPFVVNLFSGNTNRVRVASTAIIPPGTNTARFDLVLVDNDVIDGAENVVIEAWLDELSGDLDVIRVNDNESRALAVALPEQTIEGGGTLTNAGTIVFPGRPITNVLVALQSNHPELVAVPPFVTNFAGQASAPFNLMIGDNSVTNTFGFVRISASAPGFLSTTGTMTLLDARARCVTSGASKARTSPTPPTPLTALPAPTSPTITAPTRSWLTTAWARRPARTRSSSC